MKPYYTEELKGVIGNNVLLSVGINNYLYNNQLINCSSDASAVFDVFCRSKNIPFDDEKSILLNNYSISKSTFKDALVEICTESNENQQFILYFSGHGIEISNEFYFVFTDSNSDEIKTFMSMTEVIDIIKASKFKSKIILIDACRNKLDNSKTSKGKNFNFYKKYINNSGGNFIIYSCKSGEYSQNEYKENQISVFTYFLIEGLTGKTRKYDREVISVENLYQYIAEESQKASGEIQQIMQHPCKVFTGCNDIIIGLFENEDLNYKYKNTCKFKINRGIPIISENIMQKIVFLLDEAKYKNLNTLINELIYNIFIHNGKEVSCHIELATDRLSIIDNGQKFNPLVDLELNKNSDLLKGNGLKTLKQSIEYYKNILKFDYLYEDGVNRFVINFAEKAFLTEELSKIEVNRKNFWECEVTYLCDCKYYYYYSPKQLACISMARDLFLDILNQLPAGSKLIVVDCFNDLELKELIEIRNNENLIYLDYYQ